MRKVILFLAVASISVIANAQGITEAYLQKTPAIPNNTCDVKKTVVDNFENQVSAIRAQVGDDITKLNQLSKQNAKANETASKEAAMQQMSQQYGMSPEDMAKMQNAKNLSQEEKMAMANTMMMQQTNMSMGEAQNFQNMSEEGKQAYAGAYTAEAMANQQGNPQSPGTNSMALTMNELVSEQQTLATKIAAETEKINNLYAPIENDPSEKEMLDKMNKWQSQWYSMGGVDYGQGKQMDSLAALIVNEKISYCQKFSPKYASALGQHLLILTALLPDYKRMADVSDQITKNQTTMVNPPECKDIESLKALKDYLAKLDGAYKYKLYYPEDN